MKQSVGIYEFRDAFKAHNRDNFSYEGLEALFDFLESMENECSTELELDVVALCCDFTEYESLDEIKDDYNSVESLDDLQNNTMVIEFDGGIIIQHF